MKVLSYISVIIAITFFVVSCGNNSTKNTQAESQEDHSLTTLFENDHVKVAKVTLKSGEEQAVHEGINRVIYSVSDYTIKWEENGQDLGEKTWKTGDAHYHKADKHKAINTGKEIAQWLVFSKKEEAPSPCEDGLKDDVTVVSPEFTETLIDNDQFKMVKLTLPVGDSIPQHSGINRVVYSLNDYNLEYASDNQELTKREFKKGDIHWHNDCFHRLKNIGETPAEILVVSFK